MPENRLENNMVCVKGRIVSELRYSHETFGEKFCRVDICVSRASGYMVGDRSGGQGCI